MKKSPLILAALVAISAPLNASAAILYWDVNDTAAGSGGPSPTGTWDASSLFWNTDATGAGAGPLVPWTDATNTDTAIFSAGTDATGPYIVTISGTQTTGGVTVQEGTVSFAGGTVSIGTGVLAVNSGATLSIDSASRLGGSTGSKVTLNGGTLIQTNPSSAGSFISSTIDLEIGANGGTVNYTSSGSGTVSLYGGTSGTIVGTGTLTKTGPNEFRYQGVGLPNTTFSKLVVKEGLYRLGFSSSVQDERGFGAVPATFTPDAITLMTGGAIGMSFSVSLNANRGITLVGGGVINGQAGVMTIPGAIAGTGGLTILNNATLNGTNTYTGGTIINGGTLTTGTSASGGTVSVGGSSGLGVSTNPLAVNNLRVASGQTFTLNLLTSAPTTTGSLSGTIAIPSSGVNTLTVNSGGQLFTVNQTTAGSFEGVIAGTGGFTLGNLSTNALTLTGASTFSGGTVVAGGTLIAAGASASLGVGDVTVQSTGVKLTIQTGVLDAIANTATLSLAGGGAAGSADFGYLELAAGVNETVRGLMLGGIAQANGTYGSSLSSAAFKNNEYFSGTGVLTVVPEPGTMITILGGITTLLGLQRFRRRV